MSQKNEKVTIYSTPTCIFCHALMEWLDEQGVEYEDVDISNPAACREAEEKLGHEIKAVPVSLFHGEEIEGFDRASFKRILKAHQND